MKRLNLCIIRLPLFPTNFHVSWFPAFEKKVFLILSVCFLLSLLDFIRAKKGQVWWPKFWKLEHFWCFWKLSNNLKCFCGKKTLSTVPGFEPSFFGCRSTALTNWAIIQANYHQNCENFENYFLKNFKILILISDNAQKVVKTGIIKFSSQIDIWKVSVQFTKKKLHKKFKHFL